MSTVIVSLIVSSFATAQLSPLQVHSAHLRTTQQVLVGQVITGFILSSMTSLDQQELVPLDTFP
ncbi:MAG: hypothetical protein IPP49_15595 [Saprospiraceae bacterium]|nr:hypothetical protein [Saprospiraceae bacterium]